MEQKNKDIAISTVAVIGAGTMGASIAGLIASSGYKVHLFDLAREAPGSRSHIAEKAVKEMYSRNMVLRSDDILKINACNLEDDLNQISNCQLVIECIVEQLETKKQLYQSLLPYISGNAMLVSNTSTLPLEELVNGLPSSVAQRFAIAHFFNPPRYMPLLELVTSSNTDASCVSVLKSFCDEQLGKVVIEAFDTPGFIANRIGCFWLELGLRAAVKHSIRPEEADYLLSKVFKFPKTGIFGLWDLIGLDVMNLISKSISARLKNSDDYVQMQSDHSITDNLIRTNRLGRKTKAGFYHQVTTPKGKEVKVIDFFTDQYRSQSISPQVMELAKLSPAELVSHPSNYGYFAKEVMINTINYAARLVGEIAADIHAIDQAMVLGYNWNTGPIAMIDWFAAKEQSGLATIADLVVSNSLHPALFIANNSKMGACYVDKGASKNILTVGGKYQELLIPPEHMTLANLTNDKVPSREAACAKLWDVGEGAFVLEFTSKHGTFSPQMFEFIEESLAFVASNGSSLVFYHDGPHFSFGANLNIFYEAALGKKWGEIEAVLKQGQNLMLLVSQAPFPTIAAIRGYALGGGCELALHCSAIIAHAEASMGLVETKLGLIPAWGGVKETVRRSLFSTTLGDFKTHLIKNLGVLISGDRFSNCSEAAKTYFFNHDSKWIMNSRKLLGEALALARDLAERNSDWGVVRHMMIEGNTLYSPLNTALINNKWEEQCSHARHIIEVVCAKEHEYMVTQNSLLAGERQLFLEQIAKPEVQQRIMAVLK